MFYFSILTVEYQATSFQSFERLDLQLFQLDLLFCNVTIFLVQFWDLHERQALLDFKVRGKESCSTSQYVGKECSGSLLASIYSPLVGPGHVIMAISDE